MNFDAIKNTAREVYLLSHTSALLSWDQETYMPGKAIGERGDQLALIQGLIHDRMTSRELAESLEAVDRSALNRWDRALIEKLNRDTQRQMKLPKDLVMNIAKAVSLSQAAWVKARENDDYTSFAPHLAELLTLSREKAEAFGYSGHPYDALVDEYEPGMTAEILDNLLLPHGDELSSFVEDICSRPFPDTRFLDETYDPALQEKFSRYLLDELGYPMDRGRLDITAHPFTTTLGQDDVRITTRYLPDLLTSSIFGTIHEAGHGFYELGFAEDIRGNILAEATSLGIHESQSRMWENIIGRSRDFWLRFYPQLVKLFPGQLSGVGLDEFYKGINRVRRSFIRVEADEVTYNLHIILRYSLEKSLMSGDLSVDELPGAWNAACNSYFGITPPTDREGVLQDIHWSMGAFGYFPTYALGNLYAAQFAQSMDIGLGGTASLVRDGDFKGILGWLREKIHYAGSAEKPGEIVRRVTGRDLSPEPYMNYLRNKYTILYS